jgi:large subunit ribosomal protein L21
MKKYAIVETGSKQFMVNEGDSILSEKIDTGKKGSYKLDKVLMIKDGKELQVGNPYLKGSSVLCEVQGETKSEKSISYKYRRRKQSRWKKGHRQNYTKLLVKEIKVK